MHRLKGEEDYIDLVRALLDHAVWKELAGRYDASAIRRLRQSLRREIPSPSARKGVPGDDGVATPAGGGRAGRVTLFCDGGSRGNPGPAGGGGEILDGKGEQLLEFSVYFGKATNNVAEYRALIEGIDRVILLGATGVDIRLDSELLVKQVRGEYKVKSAHLAPLYRQVMEKLRALDFTIRHVPREENRVADKLAGEAISNRS